MRHSARTPPRSDFITWCVLRLMLFWKLQNALDSFEVNVLCQFSAGILHWVWCLKVWRNLFPLPYNWGKRVHKCTADHSKLDPRALRVTFCKRVGFKISKSTYLEMICWCFCVAWQMFGGIWTPTGFRRGPKIVFVDIEANTTRKKGCPRLRSKKEKWIPMDSRCQNEMH